MIEFSTEGPVARWHIRRAEKKNAFTQAMWTSLAEAAEQLAAQLAAQLGAATDARDATTPRVLRLEGEPGAFCAGADVEELTKLVRDPDAMALNLAEVHRAQRALEALPLPTLAVIDGPCFGGGFGLAACCDFRLGSSRASFAVTPARLGLLYSLADTRALVRLVGDARARRLLLRGERIDANTALAWGVLAELHEPEALAARADAWARELAAHSRTSMAGIKATLAHLAEGEHGSDSSDAADRLHARFTAAFRGRDFAEGAAAFLDKRAPRF
jgi:enoyl-CoA hydratase